MLIYMNDHKWRSVPHYSSLSQPLVITRTDKEQDLQGYTITHRESGYYICRPFLTLKQARQALPLLLNVADWSLPTEHYYQNAEISAKVQQVREQVVNGSTIPQLVG